MHTALALGQEPGIEAASWGCQVKRVLEAGDLVGVEGLQGAGGEEYR